MIIVILYNIWGILIYIVFIYISEFTDADIARSLLFTVSNDIGQIASLYAMLHGLKKVSIGVLIIIQEN